MYYIAGQTGKGVSEGLYEDFGDSKWAPQNAMNNVFGAQSGKVTTNRSESIAPWANQQPYLHDLFSKAQDAYVHNPQVAAQSPYTQAAQALTAQRALAGSPVTDAMQANIQDTLGGRYLNAGYGANENPYLENAISRALDKAKGSFLDTYGGAHTDLQNSGFKEGLSRVLAETATDAYNQNYQTERNRQMQAAALAPSAALQDYLNLQQLAGAGSSQEARSMYEIAAPWMAIAQYQNALAGNYGREGTGSEEKPYFYNPWANMMGMGSMGMGMFKNFKGSGSPSGGGTEYADYSAYSGQDLGQADYSAGFY